MWQCLYLERYNVCSPLPLAFTTRRHELRGRGHSWVLEEWLVVSRVCLSESCPAMSVSIRAVGFLVDRSAERQPNGMERCWYQIYGATQE